MQSKIHQQPLPTLPQPFSMIFIEGGHFDMGSTEEDTEALKQESPQHKILVSSFYLGQYPVTQALWKAVMNGENHSYFYGDERPVERISWDNVQVFLQKLNGLTKTTRPEGLFYDLPTEAEWEYAARGGLYHADGYRYAGSDRLKEVGWFIENSDSETKPVGLKYPNQLGLYDMSGNVFEWCADRYGGSEYYKNCTKQGIVRDPMGPEKGSFRVFRGGGWSDSSRNCRAAYRYFDKPDLRANHVGFRLALVPQSVGRSFPARLR